MTMNRMAIWYFGVVLAAAPVSADQAKVFQIGIDGFSFQNYGNEKKPINLTPASIERLCGPGACTKGTGGTCVLSSSMRALQDQLNKIMDGGHCDGIAAVGEGLFTNRLSRAQFDPKAKTTFALKNTPRLQSEIAYFWATQLTDPTASNKRRNLTPNQMIQTLRNRGNEYFTIHMYNTQKDKKGGLVLLNGHAVTPVRIADVNAETARVYIYDSNYPNQTRIITVNKKRNTWSYTGYPLKNIETKVLNLVPLSARLKQQQCWVSGNEDEDEEYEDDPDEYEDEEEDEEEEFIPPPKPQQAAQPKGKHQQKQTEIQVISDGLKIITDLIDLFAGSRELPVTDAAGSSMYQMPSGVERRFKLVPNNMRAKNPTDLYVSSGAHIMALEGLRPHRGQEDEVVLGKDGETLSYSTKYRQDLTLRINETYVGADYEIKIKPKSRKGGLDLKVRNVIDRKHKNHSLELELANKDGTPAYYTLEMTRIGDTDEKFTHRSTQQLVILPNEIDKIAYGKWIKDKQPLSVGDVANGKVIKETLIADED